MMSSRHQSVPGGAVVEGQSKESSRRNSIGLHQQPQQQPHHHLTMKYHTIGNSNSAASHSTVNSSTMSSVAESSSHAHTSDAHSQSMSSHEESIEDDEKRSKLRQTQQRLIQQHQSGPPIHSMNANSPSMNRRRSLDSLEDDAEQSEHIQPISYAILSSPSTAARSSPLNTNRQNVLTSTNMEFASTAVTPTKSVPSVDTFHTPYHQQQQPSAPFPTPMTAAATPISSVSMRPPMHSQLTQNSLQAAFDRAVSVSSPSSAATSYTQRTQHQPTSKLPSIPDLSSFSSANFDVSTDEEQEVDTPNALGLSGISIPFFSRNTTANTAPPVEPDHFSSASSSNLTSAASSLIDTPSAPQRNIKLLNFQRVLLEEQIDLATLRRMSWNGIPPECRAIVWKLLLGYLPVASSRRESTLAKRRKDYEEYLADFYYVGMTPKKYAEVQFTLQRSENDIEILKQIRQDVPRTSPAIRFFKDPSVQSSLERILYIFAIRHPASGYVQGINDLVTPFWTVFARELYDIDILTLTTSPLSPEQYLSLEADCFFCLSFLIDGIQDHYTFAQPGIQRMVFRLKELILRIDGPNGSNTAAAAAGVVPSNPTTPHKVNPNSSTLSSSSAALSSSSSSLGLHSHFENERVEFLHFSFRWMTCLLMRELKLPLILRLWDSYLSEEPSFTSGFKNLHVYVCAAFLMRWKDELKQMDFQQLIQFLQKLPTDNWNEKDVETLLAQAHVYQQLFQDSPHHLA